MNKHLYWKLQSINQTEQLEVGSKEFEIYRKKFKKDFETRELMTEAETLQHYRKNAWRNSMFSKIYSLTLAYVENNQIRTRYIKGEEKDLIQTFLNEVKSDYFKDFRLVCFGAEFLLPYLGVRVDFSGIKESIPNNLAYKGLKSWNLTGLCIRDFYSGAGVFKHSLEELAYIFNLDYSTIDPEDEFNVYQAGKIEELEESAINEIKTLVNVHRCILGESVLNEVSISKEKVETVEAVKPRNFLEILYNDNTISTSTAEGIKSKIGKKKLTKKDKENLFVILRGVLIKNDFINSSQDTKAVIAKKEKEVTEFINTL